MSFERATINWKTTQFVKMMRNGKIVFTNMVQRGKVWTREQKSLLIDSILIDCLIPPICAKKTEDGIYDMLDGQQRLDTLGFIDDEFALKGLEPFCLGDVPLSELGYTDDEISDFENYDLFEENGSIYFDLNGKYYSELPLWFRNTISNYRITMYYFTDLTIEEERKLYRRLNNGKALSIKERNIANCNDIETAMELGEHPLISEMFSRKGIERKNFVSVIMKIWTMCYNNIENISFASKDFNELARTVVITNEQKKEMEELFGYIVDIHNYLIDFKTKKVARKFYLETHLVSCVPIILESMRKNLDPSYVGDWFDSMFGTEKEEGATVSQEYNETLKGGTTRKGVIQKRNQILQDSFKRYMETVNIPF